MGQEPTNTEGSDGELAVDASGSVELYWIPLGAGTHIVRFCGRLYERSAALVQRRTPCDLYHSALVVSLPDGHYAIEQAPIPDRNGRARGVVAEGPVGVRCAGGLRLFRYEVRCWPEGRIPDLDQAEAGPLRLTSDPDCAQRIIATLPSIPTPTWGRDELHTGDMWNSNSVIAWVLMRSGVDASNIHPPPRGRAPGWSAGVRVASRKCESASDPVPDVNSSVVQSATVSDPTVIGGVLGPANP
jgi:hypothetical protein